MMINKKDVLFLLVSASVLYNTSIYADIVFKEGWDAPENSNVCAFTQDQATDYLRDASDDLKKLIDGPAKCRLEVTKGCHQQNMPHFTLNGIAATGKCKGSIYVGSRSIHQPCAPCPDIE